MSSFGLEKILVSPTILWIPGESSIRERPHIWYLKNRKGAVIAPDRLSCKNLIQLYCIQEPVSTKNRLVMLMIQMIVPYFLRVAFLLGINSILSVLSIASANLFKRLIQRFHLLSLFIKLYHFINLSKKSVIPITVNPFSSLVSLIGLLITSIF